MAKRKPERRHEEETPAYRALQARVSENLRRIRTRRCLTQEQVAELCDLDPRQIQRLEAGTANFTAVTLSKLVAGLGLDITDLVAPVRYPYY